MDRLFSSDLLIAHGNACHAMAAAQERLAKSPHRRVVAARLALMEQEALGLIEGVTVLHDQLGRTFGEDPDALRKWPFVFSRVFGKTFVTARPGATPALDEVQGWLMDARAGLPEAMAHDLDDQGPSRWMDAVGDLWGDAVPISTL